MINKKNFEYKNVILIGIYNKLIPKKKLNEYLSELELLTNNLEAIVHKKFFQKLNHPNSKTFLGIGKIQEIKIFIQKNNIDAIVFDDELTPVQIKNLEKIFIDKIITDRTQIIIDIFLKRASSSYANTQVQLAKYQYILPRLKRMWTHLERQRGGIGLRGGPGESEIETDRRIVRNRIFFLKKKLKNIDKQIITQRKNQKKLLKISLVGYTNVGKSTFMNILSESNTNCDNKLFVTLDTIVRRVNIKKISFLLSDTVGFIRKIPIQLIKSFKSTLDIVKDSDIILHIADISSNSLYEQTNNVENILSDIGIYNSINIIIFNKCDKIILSDNIKNKIFKYYSNRYSHILYLSCKNMLGINNLKNILYDEIKKIKKYYYN